MDQVAVVGLFDLEIALAGAADVRFRDFMARDGNFYLLHLRIHAAAGKIDKYFVDAFTRQFLGGAHGRQDGVLGRVHIDHAAVPDAGGSLLGNADDANTAFCVRMGDETARFRAADIQRGNDSCAKLGHGQTVSRFGLSEARRFIRCSFPCGG